jgi:hypothetical protein
MSGAITRRTLLAGALGVAASGLGARESDGAFRGVAGTDIRFASVDAARAVLGAEDEWTRATSEFQRRAVMGRDQPVERADFLAWNADAVRPWPQDQRDRWQRALDQIAPAFVALRIPLPPRVLLVASNGQESAGAPYTRAHAVVLPGAAAVPGYSDAALLAHELWHVAARHAPAVASRLYAQIGFEPVPQLDFPAAWAPARIANPDAPENLHAMRLSVEGRRPLVAPVLVASRTVLQPGESFFSVLDVRLLEIEADPAGKRSRAVLRDGEPVWHMPGGPHDYLRRLGGNTGYVMHNEETIADNVAFLVTGAPVRNPALLERLRTQLQAPR